MIKTGRSKYGTVREFLDWVKEIREKNEQNQLLDRTRIFYRGQSNHNWPILPYVFRTDKGIYREYELYNQARCLAWDVLSDSRTPMEMLVRMQHFGLPTRLIDVTHNPIVALFFACDGSPRNNGCIYWGSNEHLCNDKFADAIAREVIEYDRGDYCCKDIRRFFPETFSNIEEWSDSDKTRLVFCINGLSRPYYILPPYNNSRIKAQKGAFIIPPLLCSYMDVVPTEDALYHGVKRNIDYKSYSIPIMGGNKYIFQPELYVIPSKFKQGILAELSEMGIDRASLFPDNIEALMNQIAGSVRLKNMDFSFESLNN